VTESGPATNGGLTLYTYDDQGKLTEENGPYADIKYGYDNVGNRLTRTVSGSTTALLPNGATSNTFDLNDHIVGHTYDPDGNETTVNGQAASYDFENHLVSLASTANGAVLASYTYDANGNRVSTYISSNTPTTTSYVVDTSLAYASVVEEYSGTNTAPSARYDYGDDLVRMDRGSGVYYYIYDGLGSTRQLVNTTGAVTDSYGYSAFGELASRTPSTGGTANPFLFNAQQFDGASGDYFLRARYYDQSNGRFISQDPYKGSDETPVSLHRYLYATADPINFSDPSGLDSLGEVLATMVVNANLYKTQLTVAGIGAQVTFSFLFPDLAQDIALSMQAVPGLGAEEAATANVGRSARQAARGLDNYAARLTEGLLADEFEALNGQTSLFRALALRVRGINSQIASRNNVALADFVIDGEHGSLVGISGEIDKAFGSQFQS